MRRHHGPPPTLQPPPLTARACGRPAATYDIFPTVLNLAGVALPSDREFDGKDLLPILTLASKTSAHKCIFYWKGCTDSKTCGLPEDSPLVNKKDPGLWAVRCGSYKTHFVGESASRAFSSLQTCFLMTAVGDSDQRQLRRALHAAWLLSRRAAGVPH